MDEAVKMLAADIYDYEDHGYVVHEDRIGYKYHDTITIKEKRGYKTLFAYYYEN